jgi:hypothetical protein
MPDPGPELFACRMPEVDQPADIERVFARARAAAAGEADVPGAGARRHLVVVTPGRMLMLHPCPPAGSMSPAQVAAIEKLLSPAVKQNVAVIAYTELSALRADLSRAVPFAGLLSGLAYVGHRVWVFEGHPSALAAGSREADLLIVDGAMVPHLPPDWSTTARRAMRRPVIFVHDRATYTLRRVTNAS